MSDTLAQLFGLLRESADDLADAVLGERGERLLSEEIRRIDAGLLEARQALRAHKATRVAATREADTMKARLITLEATVESLLLQRDRKGARVLAAELLRLQATHLEAVQQAEALHAQERELANAIARLETQARRAKYQLDALRAASSLQRAHEVVAQRQSGADAAPQPATAYARRARADGSAAHDDSDTGDQASASGVDALLARLEARAAQRGETAEPARAATAARRKPTRTEDAP